MAETRKSQQNNYVKKHSKRVSDLEKIHEILRSRLFQLITFVFLFIVLFLLLPMGKFFYSLYAEHDLNILKGIIVLCALDLVGLIYLGLFYFICYIFEVKVSASFGRTRKILFFALVILICTGVPVHFFYISLLKFFIYISIVLLILALMFGVLLFLSHRFKIPIPFNIEKHLHLFRFFAFYVFVSFVSVIATRWVFDPFDSSIYNSDIIISDFNSIVEPSYAFGIEAIQLPEGINVSNYIYANLQRLIIEFGLNSDEENKNGVKLKLTNREIKTQESAQKLLNETNATAIIWGYSLISTNSNDLRIVYPMMTYRKFHQIRVSEKVIEKIYSISPTNIGQYADQIKLFEIGNDISQYESIIRPIISAKQDFSEIEKWLIYMLLEVYLSKDKKRFFDQTNEAHLNNVLAALHAENQESITSDTLETVETVRGKRKHTINENYIMSVMDSSSIKTHRITFTENESSENDFDWNWGQATIQLNDYASEHDIKSPSPGEEEHKILATISKRYDKCAKLHPNDWAPLRMAGEAYMMDGNFQDALDRFKKADIVAVNNHLPEFTIDVIRDRIKFCIGGIPDTTETKTDSTGKLTRNY